MAAHRVETFPAHNADNTRIPYNELKVTLKDKMASWICSRPLESSSGQSGGCTFSSEWFHLLPSLSRLTFSSLSSSASPHSPILSTSSNTTLSTFWLLALQLLIKGARKVKQNWRWKRNDHIQSEGGSRLSGERDEELRTEGRTEGFAREGRMVNFFLPSQIPFPLGWWGIMAKLKICFLPMIWEMSHGKFF